MRNPTTWNLEPPPGFQGIREDLPICGYERHLPHWRQTGATYFVTSRLADSIPAEKRREIEDLMTEWRRQHALQPNRFPLEQLARIISEREERWLDQGMGSCLLRQSRFSNMVATAFQHFHLERYEMGASVVMPNHFHCIVRPYPERGKELEDVTKSWKSYTGYKINQMLAQQGELWQQESYDRIVRDEEHLWRCIQYIGRNPIKANLDPESCHLWINPQWQELGWCFEERT